MKTLLFWLMLVTFGLLLTSCTTIEKIATLVVVILILVIVAVVAIFLVYFHNKKKIDAVASTVQQVKDTLTPGTQK